MAAHVQPVICLFRAAAGCAARLRDMRNNDESDSERAQSPRVAAQYIARLTEELATLARRQGFDGLVYILEMARLEADQIANSSADAG